MNNIVLNIPYSSTELPQYFWDNACLAKELIDQFNIHQTNTFIDRVFGKNTFPKIIAPYSKLYADILNTSHFVDTNNYDFILTKTNKGRVIIKPTSEYKQVVLNEYYKPLHNRIEQSVSKLCSKGKTILIDCHSHTQRDFKVSEEPIDICISSSSKYSNSAINNYIVKYFKQNGYSVDLNQTFADAFVPQGFANAKNPNLSIVRISINESLYLSLGQTNQNFKKVQKDVQNLLKQLKIADF